MMAARKDAAAWCSLKLLCNVFMSQVEPLVILSSDPQHNDNKATTYLLFHLYDTLQFYSATFQREMLLFFFNQYFTLQINILQTRHDPL